MKKCTEERKKASQVNTSRLIGCLRPELLQARKERADKYKDEHPEVDKAKYESCAAYEHCFVGAPIFSCVSDSYGKSPLLWASEVGTVR